MAADDPSAALDDIRERYEFGAKITASGRDVCASADDVPVLVAAIEAVLKLTDKAESALHEPPDTVAWTLDPAKVREAISRELTGKGEDGNHG